jgi:hypothetical protein
MVATKNPARRPGVRTAVPVQRLPTLGCGNAYSHDTRELTMLIKHTELDEHPSMQWIRNHKRRFPSARTVRRYRQRYEELGHLRRFARQGNKRATVLRGTDGLLLVWYRIIYPKAQGVEVAAFLWNSYGRFLPEPRFYDLSQISRAEDYFGLSTKRSSTTAYQARLRHNIQKRVMFWTLPYPYGVRDILAEDMIDFDEAAFFLETANRSRGKAYINCRVREHGPYGHSERWNMMLAISGGRDGLRWSRFRRDNCNLLTLSEFIESILDDIGDADPENGIRRRCFTMDNLYVHHNPLIAQMIFARGHRLAFRAPYYPVDGPIEYVFNTLQQALTQRLYLITNHQELYNHIHAIVGSIDNFAPYFHNVGFR